MLEPAHVSLEMHYKWLYNFGESMYCRYSSNVHMSTTTILENRGWRGACISGSSMVVQVQRKDSYVGSVNDEDE